MAKRKASRGLALFLLLAHPPVPIAGTLNAEALERRAARRLWRQAWPAGCREYESRKEGKRRFCSLSTATYSRDKDRLLDRDDLIMTMYQPIKRLRELAAAFGKRQARDEVGGEALTPTGEEAAASAALAAVELAAAKYAKREAERREQARKRKRELPAKRLPAEFVAQRWRPK